MQEQEVIKSLQSDLRFNDSSINKLKIFVKSVIDAIKNIILYLKAPKVTYGIVMFLILPSWLSL